MHMVSSEQRIQSSRQAKMGRGPQRTKLSYPWMGWTGFTPSKTGGRLSAALNYRRAKLVNEINTSTQIS